MAPVSPPPSPLQKMKNPFVSMRGPTRRMGPVSLRARTGTRATVSLLVLFVLIYVFNELRCLQYGCNSRVGFYGREDDDDRGPHVGGGAVIARPNGGLGSTASLAKGKDVDQNIWSTHGVVGGWFFGPKNKNASAPETKPHAATQQVDMYAAGSDKGSGISSTVLANKESKIQASNAGGDTLADQLAKGKAEYFDAARTHDLSRPKIKPGLLVPPRPSRSHPIPSPSKARPVGVALSPTASPKPTHIPRPPFSPLDDFPDMAPPDLPTASVLRKYKAPPVESEALDLDDQVRHPATEQHAKWEQGEGQEDPVRVGGLTEGEGMMGLMEMGNLGVVEG